MLEDNHEHYTDIRIINSIFLAHGLGRLLTPAEGCGFSNITHNRIADGTEAEAGGDFCVNFGEF